MWSSIFEFLGKCESSKIEERPRGRFLAFILLTIVLLLTFATLFSFVTSLFPGLVATSNPLSEIFEGAGAFLVFVIYLGNRKGYITFGALGLVGTSIVVIEGEILFGHIESLELIILPMAFCVAIMCAGLFLSRRYIILIVLTFATFTTWDYLFGINDPILEQGKKTGAEIGLIITAILLFIISGAATGASNTLVTGAIEKLKSYNQLLAEQSSTQISKDKTVSEEIVTLIAQLNLISEQQRTSIYKQAYSVREVLANLQSLLGTSNEMSSVAQDLNKILIVTNETVNKGNILIERSLGVIETNRQQVEVVTEHINKLLIGTDRLAEMAKELRLMADNTSVIAMNAQIESAGAEVASQSFARLASGVRREGTKPGVAKPNDGNSEEGKQILSTLRNVINIGQRFSAVASEVREMSGTAHELSTSINSLIKDLQITHREVRKTNETSTSMALEIEGLINSTQSSVNDMVHSLTQTEVLTNVISNGTRQQAGAINQMADMIEGISETATITNLNSSSLAEAIEALANASLVLSASFREAEETLAKVSIITSSQRL